MLRCAQSLGITEPCTKLYEAFIADGHNSAERRSLHIRCVKVVAAEGCTEVKDDKGILFNEPPLPGKEEVRRFFAHHGFPIGANVSIDHLIVNTEMEMEHLKLSASSMGQYRHSWLDIRRFFHSAGVSDYAESIVRDFIENIDSQRDSGLMKLWK